MKDEYAGKLPHLFYGLMGKTYGVKRDDSETKAKGISRSAVKKQISFFDYK